MDIATDHGQSPSMNKQDSINMIVSGSRVTLDTQLNVASHPDLLLPPTITIKEIKQSSTKVHG
jgi:hypothetical protein